MKAPSPHPWRESIHDDVYRSIRRCKVRTLQSGVAWIRDGKPLIDWYRLPEAGSSFVYWQQGAFFLWLGSFALLFIVPAWRGPLVIIAVIGMIIGFLLQARWKSLNDEHKGDLTNLSYEDWTYLDLKTALWSSGESGESAQAHNDLIEQARILQDQAYNSLVDLVSRYGFQPSNRVENSETYNWIGSLAAPQRTPESPEEVAARVSESLPQASRIIEEYATDLIVCQDRVTAKLRGLRDALLNRAADSEPLRIELAMQVNALEGLIHRREEVVPPEWL